METETIVYVVIFAIYRLVGSILADMYLGKLGIFRHNSKTTVFTLVFEFMPILVLVKSLKYNRTIARLNELSNGLFGSRAIEKNSTFLQGYYKYKIRADIVRFFKR